MERTRWNERYRTGDYSPRSYPSELLSENIEWLPRGRALDVATGTGRNALFLADNEYEVDAIDVADEALEVARATAGDRGLNVNWIRADITEYDFPPDHYDLISVSFHYDLNVIPRLTDALTTGAVIVYEHHMQPAAIVDRGPSSDRYRFRSNDLLRACLDLTVLEYRERIHEYTDGDRAGQTAAIASIIARNDLDGDPWYPPE